MTTPHISAPEGAFAPDVLMPGDPKRAAIIAERFLDGPQLVSEVRGILGFTGTYGEQQLPVSVLASGMGVPSMMIYATELARFYGVKRIIRTGTMGSFQEDLPLGAVVAASAAHTESGISGELEGMSLSYAPSFGLLRRTVAASERLRLPLIVGPVLTSDRFYTPHTSRRDKLIAMGTVGVEMEAAGLFHVGMAEGLETAALLTVSDNTLNGENMSSSERETQFETMVRIALEGLAAESNNE